MFVKRLFVFIVVLGYGAFAAPAQSDDFCKAVTTIVRDAPNGFRNIKGKPLRSANMWTSGIKVPGTQASRFVSDMGLYYEGGFFHTKNKEELKGAYDKYKAILQGCLGAHGYAMTQMDNFYPGLADYKKLIFMNDEAGSPGAKPPPHITMEVMHSKELGNYTIVMYIFEH